MNKITFRIINLLLIIFFFLDFSFLGMLFNKTILSPYFTFSLILFIFIIQANFLLNIYFIFLTSIFLSILLAIPFLGMMFILMTIFLGVYFLKVFVFDERINFFRINFNYVLFYLLFNGLVFFVYNLVAKFRKLEGISISEIDWKLYIIKFFIGLIIFNFVYKLLRLLKIIKQ